MKGGYSMEGVITGVFHNVFKPKVIENSGSLLLSEIEAVRNGLTSVTARFEFQSDPDLVESCIYEMQALTARYRYLLREARRLGIKNSAILYEQAI
jgi:hypothetical protein